MTQKRLQRLLAVCLLAGIATISAVGQDYQALLGKWEMTSETEGDPVKWTFILKQIDGN